MKRPKNDFDAAQREAEALTTAISPYFVARDPSVIGLALAQLTAIMIAGHDEELREKLLELHTDTVRELYPIAAETPRPKKETPP